MKASEECNLLALRLIEECGELIQAASKGIRFGWGSWHPDRGGSNLVELKSEFMDVNRAYDMLIDKIPCPDEES
jgi:NTP pyrophosphatase (non-canonical NTP hydrolase)